MMMTRKTMTLVSLAVIAAMAIASTILAASLPAGARLPVHWNYRGDADAFSNAWTALLLPLVVPTVATALLHALPLTETRAANLERSRGLYLAIWTSLLLIGLLYETAMVSAALRWRVRAPDFILAGVGALFVLSGNQFGKSRSMKRIGLRTPWTLANEDVWIRTHRLSGKLMVAGGLLITASAMLQLSVTVTLLILLGSTLLAILLPMGLSVLFWKAAQGPQAE